MALKMSKAVVLIAALATAVVVASANLATAQQLVDGEADQPVPVPTPAQDIDAATLLRFQSGVRTAEPSTHLSPTVRQAAPSAHLGPNYRQTTQEKRGVILRKP